jgi:hypothetical protein
MDSRKLVDPDLIEAFHGELPLIQVSAKMLKQTCEGTSKATRSWVHQKKKSHEMEISINQFA